jgi:hypothetical protein
MPPQRELGGQGGKTSSPAYTTPPRRPSSKIIACV